MKEKKKLLLIFGILLIIVIILVVILNRVKKDHELEQEEIVRLEQSNEHLQNYLKGKVTPKGCFALTKNYEGQISEDELYENLFVAKEYFADLQNELEGKNETQVKEYFDKNQDTIREYTGIDDFKKFQNLVSYLTTTNKLGEFMYASIDKSSFENTSQYLKFNISLFYENDITLNFEVHFMNNIKSKYVSEYIVQ